MEKEYIIKYNDGNDILVEIITAYSKQDVINRVCPKEIYYIKEKKNASM